MDNIKNICFSAVISRSSSNTKGGILNIKSEIPQSTLSLEENVLKCTTTVWVRIYVIKLWNSKSRIIFKDVTIKTEKDNYVVFASSKEYQLAIPVIINHEKFRNSIDIVSIDSTDWIIYSNVSQRVTIRMYLLNAS